MQKHFSTFELSEFVLAELEKKKKKRRSKIENKIVERVNQGSH
jgi:hypothetical protein